MTAQIRAFVPDDATGVARLVVATLQEFGFTAKIDAVERDLDALTTSYRGPEGGFWVAEDEGAIVGTVGVRPKTETGGKSHTCELKRLYVRADSRGAGLGERLYGHAEAFAKRAGYDRIWLDSSRRFKAAHRLYLRHGFALIESLDNDWEDDVFEKSLRTS